MARWDLMGMFMIRLTKREALILVRDMWNWLSKHPFNDKDAWPGWEKYGDNVGWPYCACCFYTLYRAHVNAGVKGYSKDACDKCPILWLWPDLCDEPVTPYTEWKKARKGKNKKNYKKYARVIRNAAIKEIKKIDGKERVKAFNSRYE